VLKFLRFKRRLRGIDEFRPLPWHARRRRDLLAGLPLFPLLLIFAGTFLLVLLSPWP